MLLRDIILTLCTAANRKRRLWPTWCRCAVAVRARQLDLLRVLNGGWATRTYARWFARPFPFVRLIVGILVVVHPRVPERLGDGLVRE